MALPIELWLIHSEQEMCDAFRERFAGLPAVTVMRSRFEALPAHDCFVTAANSFGIMNAGIDAGVVQFHGEELMKQVQSLPESPVPVGLGHGHPETKSNSLRRQPAS